MQLSGKALIKPFNLSMGKVDIADSIEGSSYDMPSLEDFNHNEDIFNEGNAGGLEAKDEENNSEGLSKEEHTLLLDDMLAVCETVTKVHYIFLVNLMSLTCFLQLQQFSFTIIHSTTIALPAWQHFCEAHGLKAKLIPQDVIMCWNSTHDMMAFALDYCKLIDSITADKSLKLWKYELDNEGWSIIEQLISVLQVSTTYSCQKNIYFTFCLLAI